LRSRIITLSCLGLRQCDISRQLKVTHGCISKLLAKYQESGILNAAQNTGRPRVITADIERKIDQYRRQDPGAFCWELRDYLLRDSVCHKDQIPSISSISRLIKNKIVHEAVEKRERDENITFVKEQRTFTPFSIANILSISNDDNKNRQMYKRQTIDYAVPTTPYTQILAGKICCQKTKLHQPYKEIHQVIEPCMLSEE